ncbi:MAG: hypothetical protein ACXWVJ_00455 [Caulobacteraceae bacterium]
MNRYRLTFALAVVLSIAMPTLAAAQAPEPGPVLRGAQKYRRPEPPPVKAPPPAPPLRSDFPGLPDTSPRLGGLAPVEGGGAACRTSCASTYYFCLREDTSTACGARWARCVTACPDVSGRP